MKRLKMKNYNTTLIEKSAKYQPCRQVELINMIILHVKNIPSDQNKIIGQAKFIYSPLRKAFEKQSKTIKDQGKNKLKKLKSMGNKQLVKSNTFIKNKIMIVKKIIFEIKRNI